MDNRDWTYNNILKFTIIFLIAISIALVFFKPLLSWSETKGIGFYVLAGITWLLATLGIFLENFYKRIKNLEKGLEELREYANKINRYRSDLEDRVEKLEQYAKTHEHKLSDDSGGG